MKCKSIGLLTAAALITISQASFGDVLLIDAYASADPSTTTAWGDAGVAGDLSGAVACGLSRYDNTYHIDGGITFDVDPKPSKTTGDDFVASDMMTDYWYSTVTENLSFGGFAGNSFSTPDGFAGVPNSNTFTLQAGQDYTLYLFGAGSVDGENSAFTFDGVTKTTASAIDGTTLDAGHFVTFDFTTPADLTGYTVDFSFAPDAGSVGTFNGAAIVSVPEPATLGMVAIFGGAILFIRRNHLIS